MRARCLVTVPVLCAMAFPAAASRYGEYTTMRIPYKRPKLPQAAYFELPSSRVVYLDGCWDGGCELEPFEDDSGDLIEDSREGYSSILSEPVTIPEYPHGRDHLEDVAACVRGLFGPFDIEVTTQDPGDAPHWRHVLGGDPRDAGFAGNVLGVAPYDFDDCLPIPNAISYGFAELVGDDVTELCELAAHEIGHTLGLDHAYLCSDPMTYLPACGPKAFQDTDAECGEQASRPCQCSARQNSHELLLGQFGERVAPELSLEVIAPAEGAEVSAGYALELAVGSEVPDRIELMLNSQYREVLEGEVRSFSPPADVPDGVHRYEITAVDQYGSRAELVFSVTQGSPCSKSRHCGGGGVCVDGRCVPGAAVEGGLGDACADGDDCLSGRCSIDPDREIDDSPSGVCVEVCEGESASGCPGGFTCGVAPDDDGPGALVCLPDRGGFCTVAPGSGPGRSAPLGLAAVLVFWLGFRSHAWRGRAQRS